MFLLAKITGMSRPAGLLLTKSIVLVCARDRHIRFGTVSSNNLHNGNTKQQGESISFHIPQVCAIPLIKIGIV